MVHQYKLNGYNIVLDTCSGSVHTVDEVAYDIIEMYKTHTEEEIVSAMLEKYSALPEVTREEILECIGDVRALEAAGKLRVEGLDLMSGFSTIISIAMWGGTALSFPFVIYFLLRFIFPALTKREKVAILFYLFAGAGCFAVGVWFSYSRIAPRAVEFFDWINGWVHLPVTTVRIEGYTSIVLKLVIAFGMVFQVPLILFVLGWLGIITSDMLRKYRRFAIVLAFVLGMVLTPPDPMSQILMAVPLCLMYELCVWGVWAKERLGIKL